MLLPILDVERDLKRRGLPCRDENALRLPRVPESPRGAAPSPRAHEHVPVVVIRDLGR
jgi:hypothetical protein